MHVHLQGLRKVSSLRLVFLLSSDDPGPWDPRDPVAAEPSPCRSTIQDLAEPEPLEPEAAFASNGNASCDVPNNLFNSCNLSCLGGHCLGKRLDAIFNSGRVLQEKR